MAIIIPSSSVNTELPAARLMADNLSLPTAPDVLAQMMVHDGSTQDMARGDTNGLNVQGGVAAAAADAGNPVKTGGKYNSTLPTYTNGQRGDTQIGTRGATLVQIMAPDAVTPVTIQNFVQAAGNTGSVPGIPVRASMVGYNGSNVDPWLNNTEATALASAARTATTNSADLVNYNARGVMVYFSITAVPGVDTVTLTVAAKDPIAGTYETLLTGAAEAGAATKAYLIYPGAGAAANGVDVVNAYPLPRTWRVTVTHSAGTSFTYSVAVAYIL